ncbi:MAG: AAC(3) family N-acetyltransferase [Clostridiaceae bacterium]|nr:AAC(3) family N-acetyltransferase [Clostridiaceae bacterium]
MLPEKSDSADIHSSELPQVSQEDIVKAFTDIGIVPGDILLIHSSLKSFGTVIGGPLTVINAAKEAVTAQGTVVFPTLVQRDFAHAYENWDINTSPSDVGLISETFRLLPDSVRSDQATHSVAAWGSRAVELTHEHSSYGPRMGPFGDYCFSYSSPWQKMYLYGARIAFLGVGTRYNTFKHFVEYGLMESYCQSIRDIGQRCRAMSEIRRFQTAGVWPFLNSDQMDVLLKGNDLISYAQCGHSLFTSFKADDFADIVYRECKRNPDTWFSPDCLEWLRKYSIK